MLVWKKSLSFVINNNIFYNKWVDLYGCGHIGPPCVYSSQVC